jgi:hypothetical protein
MITWDEPKRQENLRKHGIDLAALERVFDFPMVTDEDDRVAYGEQRLVSLGFYGGRVVVMVWTERDSGAHLISCRYADKTQSLRYRCEISSH